MKKETSIQNPSAPWRAPQDSGDDARCPEGLRGASLWGEVGWIFGGFFWTENREKHMGWNVWVMVVVFKYRMDQHQHHHLYV